ncbi:MAG: ATP-binding protein [Candidatus Thermoplasmatota archaeon]|nr:ATP-binding protein [Candidatus Thermoplasmatota archaeon]
MKRIKKRRKLHSDERILLLLHEYKGKRELWDVPQEITQKGISRKLDILENNISRSLKRLAKEELVESELKHVKGEKRRQNAYFPTYKGEEVLRGILNDLNDIGIGVILDGQEVRMSIPAAHRGAREKGMGLSLVEIYLHGLDNDLPLDLTPGWSPQRADDALIGNFQMPLHFYGREKEMEEVLDFQTSRSGVLVIWGLAGMGKTSLVLKSMSESGARSGYIRCETWTDSVELMNELGQLISELGLEEQAVDLMAGDLTPGQLSRVMKNASESIKGFTLVIDDLQKTGGGIDVYIEGICRASMDSRHLKVVLLTRERPSFLDPRYEIHGSVRSMELKGLDPRAVALMIKAGGKGGDIGAIWDMTKGHPLFIELYMSSMAAGSRAMFTGFLDQEIFSPLPPSQRKALQLAALAGQPVHRTLLSTTSSEDIEVLKRKGLLKEVGGELLFIHDLLSDHVIGTVDPKARMLLLRDILSYRTAVILRVWSDGPDILSDGIMESRMDAPDWMMEIMDRRYSSIPYEDEPGLRELFKSYLDSNISMLIEVGMKDLALALLGVLSGTSGRGRGRLLIGAITRLERANLSEDQLFSIRLQKALMETLEGDLKGASKTIQLIEATYPSGRIRGRAKAQLQHIKGKVSRSEEKYEEMIRSHEEALATYDRIGDGKGAAKERLHLSKALHQGGMAERALKEAIRSASEFEDIMDRKSEVYSCLQAFRSAIVLGKKRTSQKCIDRAEEVSRSIGDKRLRALVEIEKMIHLPENMSKKSVHALGKIAENLDRDDLHLAVRGFLRIAEDLTGDAHREVRAHLLDRTNSMLLPLMEDASGNEGVDIEERYDTLLMILNLREQTLDILETSSSRELARFAKVTKIPFVKVKGDDPKGHLLLDMIETYQNTLKLLRKMIKEGVPSKPDIDGPYEGVIHSCLLAGIHFRKNGKVQKARKMFSKCRTCITEYERMISEDVDRTPGFNLRTVKEVLEENRSTLEEEKN